jgi:hypothetical protein
MQGMSASTGRPLTGVEHLRQSIADILSTPRGSRVGARTYGAGLWELIDRPMTQATVAEITQQVAEALAQEIRGEKVEPRFVLYAVNAEAATPGRLDIVVTGLYVPTGEVIDARVTLAR